MKIQECLMASVMTLGAVVSIVPATYAADGSIPVKVGEPVLMKYDNPRNAANDFVENINYARVALAMKKPDLAKQHIAQAREIVSFIKSDRNKERRIRDIGSGRIAYQYDDSEERYHYFPVRTGPVYVQQMSNGPAWAANNLAVTDADSVYLTLDLEGNEAYTYLNKAEAAVTDGKLKEAGSQLAKLTSAVMTVEHTIALPLHKARDNIILARNFVAGKNYEGARYALRHADEAMDYMEKNDSFINQHARINAMREDVHKIQIIIDKKDPTMLEQADRRMEAWWNELDGWVESIK